MKLIILVLSLAAVASAQLDSLTKHEVDAIVAANPSITVDQCTDICDGLFDLIDDVDEQVSDTLCKSECDCKINQNCQNIVPTTMPATTTTVGDITTDAAATTTKAPQTTNAHHHHTHHPHPTHPNNGHHG